MITAAIISVTLGAISAVFGLLPTWTPPTLDNPDTYAWLGYPALFDRILPIGFLFTFVAISLVISVALYAWDLTFFVYHQFWGAS